jgi:hypothetical protein
LNAAIADQERRWAMQGVTELLPSGQLGFLIHGQLKTDSYRANSAIQCMQTGAALNQSFGHGHLLGGIPTACEFGIRV